MNKRASLNPLDIEQLHTDLLTVGTSPAIEKITKTISQATSGKRAWPDTILAETIESEVEAIARMSHFLFTKISVEKQVPTDRKEGYLIKIQGKKILVSMIYIDASQYYQWELTFLSFVKSLERHSRHQTTS